MERGANERDRESQARTVAHVLLTSIITTFTRIQTYLILADVLSPWKQRKAVLPSVLGRVVDHDRVLRREIFVEVLGRTCPSGGAIGGDTRKAIAGRCGDRVRWAHKEVRRGGRGLGGGLGVCDRRTCTRDRRERHG